MKQCFYNIFFKITPFNCFWAGIIVLFCSICFYVQPAYAADVCQGMSKKECEMKYLTDSEFREQINNSNIKNGYACPGMNVLKERYQGDCFPCEIVNVLLASFMRAASQVYDVSKEAGNKLLLLGSAIWVAFWALRKVSSLANVEPSSMTNELIIFFGKVLVAYCFINAGIGTLVSYAINPILAAGADFGSAMLLETEGIDISSTPKAENQYSGPTDIVSKPVMDKILKLSEGVSNEVATNFVIGSGLTCFSIQNGLHINVIDIIDIRIPDIWLWLCGAAIWFVGFMLVLSVCYYLIDIPFKIGFAIIALPVVIGLWPFKITAGKLKSIVGIALNAAFTFLFLALSSSYAIRLISQAFSAEGDLEIEGQSYSGKEALFKAFEVDNVEYVQSLFDFTGPAFLIIIFCYIYAIKMISEITNNYPNKFDTGMTSAAGSPMHHMATAATMWTTGKISKPFKTGLSIISHQAGKAATTVTKAAANVGIGAAGAAVGAHNKFVGKMINKATSGWVKKQQASKAAADSLDKYNSLHADTDLGTKIQGKLGKLGANIGLGLANTVNRFGQSMENSGDMLMNPGKNTLDRIVSAAKAGGAEVKEAGKELGGALAETAASMTPQVLAEKLQQSEKFGKIGNAVLQTKSDMKTQAHQDFDKSVQKFGDATQTVAQSAVNTGQRLASAFSAINTGIADVRSGAAKDRLSTIAASKIKYVTSGKIITDIKNNAAASIQQMNARTAKDIERSKEQKFGWKDVGQNFKQNLHMAQADLGEAKQSFLHGNMKRNWNDLKDTVANFKKDVSDDTGIKNKYGAAAVTLTGIGLGIAAARNLGKSLKEGGDYIGEAKVDDLMSAIGKGVVRPSIALGMTLVDTTRNTVDSAYKLTEGTLLTGIGVAQTVLAPVGNLTRSALNVGAAVGDTGLAIAAAGGSIVGMAATHLNVAYQYTKYATRPAAAVIGMPFRGAGKVLGFAAKTVDNSLYAGYRAVASVGKGTMQVGNVLGQGANVLYHGVKDRTIAGQIAAKTFKSGSKTLKVAAKTLKLGRNIILAAAGEDIRGPRKENKAEREERNKQYRQQQKEKRRLEEQRRKEEQRKKERDERQREEDENWNRYEEENRRAEEEKDKRRSDKSKPRTDAGDTRTQNPPVSDNNRNKQSDNDKRRDGGKPQSPPAGSGAK